ncbi:MAG: hypothetical protein ABSD63_12425 [Candidatus Korobacteraceae bacterium]
MVCSACGYENQAGNRYCGMCGIPLPHRPLTTAGAQSTASLTRPLAENAGPLEPRASVSQARTGVASESPLSGDLARPSQDPDVERDTPAAEAASQHSELVPEIPLDEYVQSFRYVPPSDPEESTMRGETSVLRPKELRPELVRPEPPAPSNGTSGPSMETETATAITEAPPAASADDVRERLGLEVDGPLEERSDRPRFLDFNQPSTPIKPARTTPSISGPSFLGLNDPPPIEAETGDELDELEVEGLARRIWRIARIGLALAVVVVFGWLGVLEWKAQVGQTSNGPVEVVKMKMRGMAPNGRLEIIKAKMRSLVHDVAAEIASPAPPPATASNSASKPEMKVEPPPKPQNQNSAADTATSPPAEDAATAHSTNPATTPPANSAPDTTASPGNQPAAGQPAAAPAQNPAPNASATSTEQNAASAKTTTATAAVDKSKAAGSQPPGPAAKPTAGKPKPSPPAADDDQEVVVKKIFPGAEELAKANNASDSAAEAAWLWKATAKGNPTAPVRLAGMYVKGEGVPRSCEQALVLLKTAAEKENAVARNQLASMYGSGVCVPRNRVEAYRWASSALAANPNSDWAQQRRDQLWQQMTPEERALAEKYR